MNNNIKGRITPLLISLGVIVGILIGTFCTSHFSGNRLSIINTGTNKLSYLLQIIDNNYVDTVNMSQLVEDAMPGILKELDPHSSYLSVQDAKKADDDQGQKNAREPVHRVRDPHHDLIQDPTEISGNSAEQNPDAPGKQHNKPADGNCCAHPLHHS